MNYYKMNNFIRKLGEHAAAIVIGAIVLIVLILAVIVFVLASAGNSDRRLIIEDIAGSAFILKTDGQMSADKNMKLESGDVLITSADSTVRLSADKDKSVYVEPDTTLYIYYTDASDKGSIVVNISEGAAVCRLDSPLGKNEVFEVKTPNAVISCTGTVFRTQFSYFDTYGSYTSAKVTDVDCVDGSVNIQLYDNDSMPAEPLMMLTEGKSARLLTAAESVRYEYLNSDIRTELLSENALKTFIRIAAERRICFSLGDLNDAYQVYLNGGTQTEQTTLFDVDNYEEDRTYSDIFTSPTGSVTGVTTDISGDSSVINSENMDTGTTGTEFTGLPPEDSITVTTVPDETSQSIISVTSPTLTVYTVSAPGTADSSATSPIAPAVTTAPRPAVTTTPPTVTTTAPVITTTPPTVTTTAPVITTTPPTVTTTAPVITTTTPAVTTTTPAATTTTPAVTTAPPEETTVTTTTTPAETTKNTETTVPWWEIINSAALTKDRTE